MQYTLKWYQEPHPNFDITHETPTPRKVRKSALAKYHDCIKPTTHKCEKTIRSGLIINFHSTTDPNDCELDC